MTSSGTVRVPILTGATADGWMFWNTERMPCLNSNITRTTLMPPPVEYAQPPMKLTSSIKVVMVDGQRLKSADAKPAVVPIDTTWNSAFSGASKPQ